MLEKYCLGILYFSPINQTMIYICKFIYKFYILIIFYFRSWYERNKHIFPASRWEPFDPTKSYDKYTVSDKNRKKDKI